MDDEDWWHDFGQIALWVVVGLWVLWLTVEWLL